MGTILKIKNVTKMFGGLEAVSNVNIDIEKGQIVSLIGPNGAGKTTIFNIITGVYPPSKGFIIFEDSDIRTPFSRFDIFWMLFLGALIGSGVLLSTYGIHSFQIFMSNYLPPQKFEWGKALLQSFKYLFYTSIWPYIIFLLSFFLGVSAYLLSWYRGRYKPYYTAIKGIARTFQNIRIFGNMSVIDNVVVGMHPLIKVGFLQSVFHTSSFRNEEKKAYNEAFLLLEKVGLKDKAEFQAKSLSYGDQRRLEIARALALKPKLLLLDEPTAGMNPLETSSLMELIKKLQKDMNLTIFLIEHDMKVVMGISDKIFVLNHGVKIAEGPPQEIQKNKDVIEAYLGEMNTTPLL